MRINPAKSHLPVENPLRFNVEGRTCGARGLTSLKREEGRSKSNDMKRLFLLLLAGFGLYAPAMGQHVDMGHMEDHPPQTVAGPANSEELNRDGIAL